LKSDTIAAVDGICHCIYEFYYIGDRRGSFRPIRSDDSDPPESATIQFQSDNRQFSSMYVVTQ